MRRLWPALAALVYLLLALYQLFPAWMDLGHGVVGEWTHPDMISNHWLYRWIPEQLLAGRSIVHNDRYYLPIGDAPWLAGNGSDAVPYTLLALLLPWPGSVTVWVLGTLVLNGLSAYALARALGGGQAGALLAGAAVGFSPYLAGELAGARIAQAPLYWMGFFLAVWFTLLERAPTEGKAWPDRRTVRWAIGAGLLYGGAAFTYWYYGLWAAWFGAIAFAFRPRWRALVPFVPMALITTVPPLAIFLAHWSEIPGTAESTFPSALATQSSLAVLFPIHGGPGWWGGITLPLALVLPAALALGEPLARALRAGAGLRGALRALPWTTKACAAAGLLFYLLALGPYPSWSGSADHGVPGPFWLFYGIGGPLRRYWWPYRHIAGLAFALAPLAAQGADRIFGWLQAQAEGGVRPAVPLLAALGFSLLIPIEVGTREGTTSAPTSWFEAPDGYKALDALPGDGILELPISPPLVGGQQTLSYQWVHHKRMLNGHAMWVDRVRPAAWDAWVAKNGFLTELKAVEGGEHTGPFTIDAAALAELKAAGLRYLVVNEEYFPADMGPLVTVYDKLFTAMFGAAVLNTDDQIHVWDLEATGGAAATGVSEVDVLPFRTPVPLRVDRSGAKMPMVGEVKSLGWNALTRRLPFETPDEQVASTKAAAAKAAAKAAAATAAEAAATKSSTEASQTTPAEVAPAVAAPPVASP